MPDLVDEAAEALDREGLLDYVLAGDDDDEGDGGDESDRDEDDADARKRKVKVLAAGALGTDERGMLRFVDDLVREALERTGEGKEGAEGAEGFGLVPLGGRIDDDEADENEERLAKEKEAEAKKYANRAALLENALEGKAKELTTMSHRVSLLESSLGDSLAC